jgi:hypothetical protein
MGRAMGGLTIGDGRNVPVICPTCQKVFFGSSIPASDPFLFKGFLSLHGVVFDILVWRSSMLDTPLCGDEPAKWKGFHPQKPPVSARTGCLTNP